MPAKKLMTMAALVLSATLMWGSQVLSQDPAKDAAGSGAAAGQQMPDMQEMMRKWMAAATPGPKHKLLDPFVGQWVTTTKIWMGGPGAPPMETRGKATFKWVLDKRFLLQEAEGEMLMPDEKGQMGKVPHKGMGLSGYDNYRNLFIGTWADNAGTAILQMTGTADPSGKVITMYAEMDEPMLDVRGRMVKFVTTWKAKDHFVFEIFDLHAGPDFKVVEVAYARK